MSTIGNTATPTGEDNTGEYRIAFPFTMPENGTLTGLSAWCRNGTGANNIIVALYTDASGLPGTKLADTGSLAETVGGSLGLASGSASVSLSVGVTYWLVVSDASAGGNSTVHVVGKIATGTLYYSAGVGAPSSAAWAASGDFGTSTGSGCMYATYTPAGGGAVINDHNYHGADRGVGNGNARGCA